MAALLSLEDVHAGYPGAPVLRGVGLEAEAGQLWAVLGPNGAGKTTLLKVALGLLAPSRGVVRLEGVPLAQRERADVARRLGWVPQHGAEVDFTGLELALMGAAPRLGTWGLPSQADVEAARAALAEAGVAHLADRPLQHASGGERRMAWLARALVQQPRVLLLDEPTAFLDLRHQVDVLARVRARVDRGLCAVAVLHDVNLAASFATHALLLKGGAALAQGPLGEVLTAERLSALFDVPVERGAVGHQAVFAAQVRP